MKKNKTKNIFLDSLRKVPIVQISCDKANISRNSVYRWRKEDKEFADDMDKAMAEGEDFINDISEGQLLNMIKEKSWPALAFWLKHRNPKFKEKFEVTTKIGKDEEMTPDQEVLFRKAIGLSKIILDNKHGHE